MPRPLRLLSLFFPPIHFFPHLNRAMVSLILLSVLASTAYATASIKCYSCMVPKTESDFTKYCDDKQFCKGKWCTKGPDARSSGLLYGCIDQAPVEIAKSTCKAVNTSHGAYYNCYCNNIEFCNGGGSHFAPLLWLAVVAIGFLFA